MAVIQWVGEQGVGEGQQAPAVFSLTPAERLRRQWLRLASAATAPDHVLVIRFDVVVDTPALAWLMKQDALVVTDAAGVPLIGWVPQALAHMVAAAMRGDGTDPALAAVSRPAAALSYFSAALKKTESFQVFALSETPVPVIERRLYFASYKGVTDIVTKYAWPWPALAAVYGCIRIGASPNAVTSLSILLSIAAIPLFLDGFFVVGLLAAWAMTFLDTVDGKLARVTVSYTSFGNYFDHVADIVFPPLWWWAYMAGLIASGRSDGLSADTMWLCFWIILGTYVVGRLCEGWFELRHRFVPFLWRRFDARLRLVLARRNPNLILLTAFALLGLPAWGYVAVTLWCAICAALQLVALVQSELAAARQGGKLTPYLSAAAPGAGDGRP